MQGGMNVRESYSRALEQGALVSEGRRGSGGGNHVEVSSK